MHDQGDKIVTLAREMLRSEPFMEPESSLSRISLSFKVLCFATMLAAFGSSGVTLLASEAWRPLNRYERTELQALFYYAALKKGIHEKTLRSDVRDKFGFHDLDDMTPYDYSITRRYLQDIAR
ncbi:MAG: hypothetical protein SFW62_10080 [Alphaproteobacteria bacterium]|nr:hypothetical protein [Alphaproteobacteria bacterium]